MLTLAQLQKTLNIAEKFYGTSAYQQQIPINKDSFYKLMSLHNETTKLKTDQSGEPISWVVVV